MHDCPNMTYNLTSILLVSFIFLLRVSFAEITESFVMKVPPNTPIGSPGAVAGASSVGWMSTWQNIVSEARYSDSDLTIQGLSSSGGALNLRGEKKERAIGKAVVMRQIDSNYSGDIYGQFRFTSGNLLKDSVVALLLSVPGTEPPTPRNSIFSICPKRWGSNFGMIKAGEKDAKVESGVACEAFQNYLVLWKLENLPSPGQRKKIQFKFWVLDSEQASHFASSEFDESILESATVGSAATQVCQTASVSIANSKRTFVRGMVISLFSSSVPRLYFDEILISQKGF